MLIKQNKGQSILEYAILLGVVIAALLIMQSFVKRGYQGSLKGAADKMGEQFSAGGTTEHEQQMMTGNQIITSEVNTGAEIQQTQLGAAATVVPDNVFSVTSRNGAQIASTSESRTDAAQIERTRWGEYQDTDVPDFQLQ